MEHTYRAYRGLLALLKENDYPVRSYHNYEDASHLPIIAFTAKTPAAPRKTMISSA